MEIFESVELLISSQYHNCIFLTVLVLPGLLYNLLTILFHFKILSVMHHQKSAVHLKYRKDNNQTYRPVQIPVVDSP